MRIESDAVVEYPVVVTRFDGPVRRIAGRIWPVLDNCKRREPLLLAVRLVSAFCSSRGDKL